MTENCSCCHPATHRPLRRPGAQGGAAEPLVGAAASCPLCDPSAVCSSACPARAEAQPLPGHLQLPGQGLLSWGSSWELGAGVTRKAGSDWGRGLWQGCGGSPSAVAKAPDPPGGRFSLETSPLPLTHLQTSDPNVDQASAVCSVPRPLHGRAPHRTPSFPVSPAVAMWGPHPAHLQHQELGRSANPQL